MTDRRLVDTRYGQVHVRGSNTNGAGRPLVLLHMSPQSSLMWTWLQAALARPSYALDRLGYGLSDAPSQPMLIEDHARATLEVIDALGIDGFDVLGMHTGALEAIELTHLAAARIRRCGIVGVPAFSDEEKQALAGYTRQVIVPHEDGSHLAATWRARFQYREPPYDLADVQRRFTDYLLAPDPGAAYVAVFAYAAAARISSCPVPLTAFVPRDDIHAVSLRSRALLPAGSTWLDCADLDVDLFRTSVPRLLEQGAAFFAA